MRFTRIVIVMCTLAVVGVLYFIMTSELAVLPDLVLGRFMGNMETLVNEASMTQIAINKKKAAGKPIEGPH